MTKQFYPPLQPVKKKLQNIAITAPFIDSLKARAEDVEPGVPFELTWNCYGRHEKACGVCGACRDCTAGFLQDIIDSVTSKQAEGHEFEGGPAISGRN